jgi:hypothetical protein
MSRPESWTGRSVFLLSFRCSVSSPAVYCLVECHSPFVDRFGLGCLIDDATRRWSALLSISDLPIRTAAAWSVQTPQTGLQARVTAMTMSPQSCSYDVRASVPLAAMVSAWLGSVSYLMLNLVVLTGLIQWMAFRVRCGWMSTRTPVMFSLYCARHSAHFVFALAIGSVVCCVLLSVGRSQLVSESDECDRECPRSLHLRIGPLYGVEYSPAS